MKRDGCSAWMLFVFAWMFFAGLIGLVVFYTLGILFRALGWV